MLHGLISQLVDEAAANILLHRFLRHRRAAPFRGVGPEGLPGLFSGDLQAFYAPRPVPVDLSAGRLLIERNADRTVWDCRFASETTSAWPENDLVWCRHWQAHAGDSGLTVVGVNGIVQLGCRWFRRLAEHLAPQGIDVVMMDGPGNFRRTPKGYRPGQLVLGGDLAHQLAMARQAALDLWRVIASAQQQGRRVGLVGVSYGGWLTLLAGLLAPHLEFLIALVPPVDFAQMLQKSTTIVREMRRGLGAAPIDSQELERLVRPVIPSHWSPRLAGSRIILHAARFDRFVPCRGIERLSRTWGTPLVMHEEAHYRLTLSGKVIAQVAQQVLALNAQRGDGASTRYHEPGQPPE